MLSAPNLNQRKKNGMKNMSDVSRSWFNLDASWAVSLILVGARSLSISLASQL
jgi:hypothetical protein